MYPLSDNDMDRISREASEQFDVEPSTSGWDRLEKRLDKELPKEKDRRRFLWIFLLFLLLGGGLLSLQLINTGTSAPTSAVPATLPNSSPVATTESAEKTPSAASTQESALPATENPADPSTASLAPPTANKKAEKQETYSAPSTVAKDQGLSVYSKRTKSVNQKKTIPPTALVSATEQKEVSPIPGETGTGATGSNTPDKTGKAQNGSSEGTIEKPVTATPVSAIPVTDSIEQKATPEVANVTAAAKKKGNNPPKNRLALGLTAGIDWSRIHSMADERNGYNVGITVSYDISPRWSVTTGAIITRKKYTALGKDFNPPDHYWTTYVKLQTLEGYCQMIDIPLNLRYNITNRKQSKLFATTGLSSYLMSSQYYKYYYINSANQAMERDWTSTKNTAYWMGILNLSAGYEKQLSTNWSLQAEPFLKLPLRGVGFGKMDISSYGALFTLKYRPKF